MLGVQYYLQGEVLCCKSHTTWFIIIAVFHTESRQADGGPDSIWGGKVIQSIL